MTSQAESTKVQSSFPSAKRKSRSKKRRRTDRREESLTEESKQERYDKLLRAATKELTKNAKLVRGFECKKAIRSLKKSTDGTDARLERKLDRLKALSVKAVVQQSLRRLGLLHLDPSQRDEPSETTTVPELSPEDDRIVLRIIQHKKMEQCLERWNRNVTEYRKWCLLLDEGDSSAPKRNVRKTAGPDLVDRALANNSSMFCALGGGGTDDDVAGGGDAVACLDDGYQAFPNGQPAKKNRPGQRARRAKAAAIQARLEGREQHESLNWRAQDKKPSTADGVTKSAKKRSAPYGRQQDEPSQTGKASRAESKDAASAHPSWAAKQSQKVGIVAFQGKKITFD